METTIDSSLLLLLSSFSQLALYLLKENIIIKLSTISLRKQEKIKKEKRRASMIRELLDRFPCSNASRNAERKRGRGRSMEIE